MKGQDIPEIAASALVATETRPRCDQIEDGALVNIRGPAAAETVDSDRLVSMRMWVRHGKVISVTRRPLSATEAVRKHMEARALLISIVALIFLPLTFITGLLGMNVQGIPYADEPWAFWAVVALCLLIAVLVIGYFARIHWLRR